MIGSVRQHYNARMQCLQDENTENLTVMENA